MDWKNFHCVVLVALSPIITQYRISEQIANHKVLGLGSFAFWRSSCFTAEPGLGFPSGGCDEPTTGQRRVTSGGDGCASGATMLRM
jgi:hypothetical protein